MPSQRVLTKAAPDTAVDDKTASVHDMRVRTTSVLPATPERKIVHAADDACLMTASARTATTRGRTFMFCIVLRTLRLDVPVCYSFHRTETFKVGGMWERDLSAFPLVRLRHTACSSRELARQDVGEGDLPPRRRSVFKPASARGMRAAGESELGKRGVRTRLATSFLRGSGKKEGDNGCHRRPSEANASALRRRPGDDCCRGESNLSIPLNCPGEELDPRRQPASLHAL